MSARTAILLALRQGPSYGRELVRRVSRASGGHVRLSEGTLYPALRTLRAARLVRAWNVVPGQRRGARARTYYELTIQGIKRAESDASTLIRLASGDSRATTRNVAELEAMQINIERAAELSEDLMTLRDAVARAGRLV
ncbi:MAG: PadR family transcriptional regulator [Vicinamibacterales bacterium]